MDVAQPTGRPRTRWWWLLAATVPAALLAGCQQDVVRWFVSDDAFISLRYAERLLAGDGLTWTDGERVEGYSNLLWILLVAALGATGLDLVTAASLLGDLATGAALLAIASVLRPHDLRSAARASLAPLLAASTQVVLGWTSSGLEGPLVLCLLAFGFVRLWNAHAAQPDVAAWPRRGLRRAGIPFALLCLTRPDGPLWVLATGLVLAAVARGSAGARAARALWFGSLPLLAVLSQLLFRVVYHGDVVPNTARVKATFDPARLGAGIDYVLAAIAAHAGLFAAAAAAVAVLLPRRDARVLAAVLGVPVVVWLCYLAAIGGDHFPCRRLLHGAIAPLALLVAVALRELATTRATALATAAAVLLAAAWNVLLARTDPQTHELRGEVWEWRGREVGLALRDALGDRRPLLAVDAAGAVPFYSELPCLDMLGLCDRTIARTPPPAWLDTVAPGTPKPPGHLHGNGRYVMDRAPDLLLFGPPPHLPLPVFVSALEFEDDPRFRDGFRCVLVELPDRVIVGDASGSLRETLRVPLWVRLDGVAGIGRTPDRVEIPGYLFGSMQLERPLGHRRQQLPPDPARDAADAAHTAAWAQWYGASGFTTSPDANGALVLRLAGGDAALRCALPAGTWRADVEPPGAAVRLVGDAASSGAGTTTTFSHAAGGDATLRLQRIGRADGTGASARTTVARVVLTRVR
jgi:arabinofuranosyltransferase